MSLAVVVDVQPQQAQAALHALATCNAALGRGQCALAKEGNRARWYAVIRFDLEHQALLSIDLYSENLAGQHLASSQLEFKVSDPPGERWASAGVVVAALVAARSEISSSAALAPATATPATATPATATPATATPATATPATATPATATPATATPLHTRGDSVTQRPPGSARTPTAWLRFDLGATAGSEFANETLRLGPLGRIELAFADTPVFVFATGAYTVRSTGTPKLTWLTGSLGVGGQVAFARQRMALDARAAAVVESVSIHATAGGRAESAERSRLGANVGLDLIAYFARDLALFAGLEAAMLRPRVDITVAGQAQDGLQPFSWGFVSGLRYDFR